MDSQTENMIELLPEKTFSIKETSNRKPPEEYMNKERQFGKKN